MPAYHHRFIRTFGFYENRAAVITREGWGHVDPRGDLVYVQHYSWVGNFQDGQCVVRSKDNEYFHILPDGSAAYREKYLYTGDFRNGIAVVRLKNGLNTHIYKDGSNVHGKMFLDLDIYHKGFARARDNRGWCHVDMNGNSSYEVRFSLVEPFYNGFALVWAENEQIGIINEKGEWVHTIVAYDKKSV
ncbi:MAG: WG repeat-containing protein [Promethearchaeota archaeon]